MGIFDALGSLVGGYLGMKGAEKQNETNMAIAERNIALQKEFAQSGIQWKVADAEKAGIHPLYALGASTASYSPVSVGAVNTMSPLADMAKSLGQDVSRAVDATRTEPQRVAARIGTVGAIEGVRGQKLDNADKELRLELTRLQIQRLQQQLNPPMPAPGDSRNFEFPGSGGNTALVNPSPAKITTADPSRPHQEGGATPDIAWSRTPSGGYAPMPSESVKERIEDSPYEWAHFVRTLSSARPPFAARPGHVWSWNWPTMEYRERPYTAMGRDGLYKNVFDRYRFYLERR